jgi:hypothetical protein
VFRHANLFDIGFALCGILRQALHEPRGTA